MDGSTLHLQLTKPKATPHHPLQPCQGPRSLTPMPTGLPGTCKMKPRPRVTGHQPSFQAFHQRLQKYRRPVLRNAVLPEPLGDTHVQRGLGHWVKPLSDHPPDPDVQLGAQCSARTRAALAREGLATQGLQGCSIFISAVLKAARSLCSAIAGNVHQPASPRPLTKHRKLELVGSRNTKRQLRSPAIPGTPRTWALPEGACTARDRTGLRSPQRTSPPTPPSQM